MSNIDGVVLLNNYLQATDQLAQLVWEESKAGLDHAPEWTAKCKINGEVLGVGTGTAKHIAKDVAARAALEILKSAT